MSELEEKKGICNSCNNASTCIYLMNSEKSIFECEEFDDFVPNPTAKSVIKNEKEIILNKTDKYKGLCSDCEKQTKCMYCDVDRGVLHCEEYVANLLHS